MTVERKYLSLSEVAAIWGVHRKTVQRMVDAGTLPAVRLSSRQLRVRVADAEAIGTPVRSARAS
jgi:excisionase family DNA binding protein